MKLVETVSGSEAAPGVYLSDGYELFRVDRVMPDRDEDLVLLENCRTFDYSLWPTTDLFGAGLKFVETGRR